MSTYFFLFGSHKDLSAAELAAVNLDKPRLTTPWAAGFDITPAEAERWLKRLGGTIKVAELVGEEAKLSTPDLELWLIDHLSNAPEKKVQFAITTFGRDHLPSVDLFQIKARVEANGKKVRFREGEEYGLSAAVKLKPGFYEYLVFHTSDHTYITRTTAVQDINDWTKRDRSKPYADRKKGMLPPKLARIMLNLGLENQDPQDVVLYDPFCGSGTILMEGMVLGLSGYGSDLDPAAVAGSQQNLAWLKEELDSNSQFEVFEGDVSHVPIGRLTRRPTLIVTEPFLGRPKPKPNFVPHMFKGLEKLYLGAFKHWAKILPDSAQVVIIFPMVRIDSRVYSLEKLIDKLAEIGYTTYLKPLEYGRPGAVTHRQIWRFTYHKQGK